MQENPAPKLSVCLLTYNHIELLPSCISSILAQTVQNFEFIISDDCSSDGTWEWLCELKSSHPEILISQTKMNWGMAKNANAAISQCNGEFIALLHHDDIYHPQLLEKWLNLISSAQSIAFAFNSYSTNESNHIYSSDLQKITNGKFFLKKYMLPFWGCPVRGTAIFRKSHLVSCGGFREEFSFLSDVDLFMRLARTHDVGYCDTPLICMRNQRPDYYPSDYDLHAFSWNRIKLLHRIHATNRIEFHSNQKFFAQCQWLYFLIRLNFDTAKWLLYLLYKKKFNQLAYNKAVDTSYEFKCVIFFRKVLSKIFINAPR